MNIINKAIAQLEELKENLELELTEMKVTHFHNKLVDLISEIEIEISMLENNPRDLDTTNYMIKGGNNDVLEEKE